LGEVITIGLDIAKSVFQVHGVDGAGAVVVRKRISPTKVLVFFADLPPCLIGIEACPSAHHWGRELQALGHTVRLMPRSYVKAYLKRSKNDANDAAAICEAVTRPSMRFQEGFSWAWRAAAMKATGSGHSPGRVGLSSARSQPSNRPGTRSRRALPA
jgi:transposase